MIDQQWSMEIYWKKTSCLWLVSGKFQTIHEISSNRFVGVFQHGHPWPSFRSCRPRNNPRYRLSCHCPSDEILSSRAKTWVYRKHSHFPCCQLWLSWIMVKTTMTMTIKYPVVNSLVIGKMSIDVQNLGPRSTNSWCLWCPNPSIHEHPLTMEISLSHLYTLR